MTETELYRWYLPPRFADGKPYLSSSHMDATEAAKLGAIRPEPASRIVLRSGALAVNGALSHMGPGPKD